MLDGLWWQQKPACIAGADPGMGVPLTDKKLARGWSWLPGAVCLGHGASYHFQLQGALTHHQGLCPCSVPPPPDFPL